MLRHKQMQIFKNINKINEIIMGQYFLLGNPNWEKTTGGNNNIESTIQVRVQKTYDKEIATTRSIQRETKDFKRYTSSIRSDTTKIYQR